MEQPRPGVNYFSEFQFSKFKMTKSLDFEKSITKIHWKIEKGIRE